MQATFFLFRLPVLGRFLRLLTIGRGGGNVDPPHSSASNEKKIEAAESLGKEH